MDSLPKLCNFGFQMKLDLCWSLFSWFTLDQNSQIEFTAEKVDRTSNIQYIHE